MDRKLKFILILFPVILVGTYIYSLWDPYANDVLDGSKITGSTQSNIILLSCPVGYIEGHVDSFEPFVATPVCFSTTISNPFDDLAILSCGDSIVDQQGMVQTVECTIRTHGDP